MTTYQIRKNFFDLSQKELSDILHVPKRTIERWDSRRSMLPYVFDLAYWAIATLNTDYQFYCADEDIVPDKLGFIEFCKYHFTDISNNFEEKEI